MDRKSVFYPVEATSVTGFVQQVAVSYVSNGYFFYVSGFVPEGKDPRVVDAKLLARYEIDISKWSRARRREAGKSSLQYIRHGRLFLLLATHGKHRFFKEEAKSIRDARRTPIKAFGYAISHRAGHVHVRIEQSEYERLKAFLIGIGKHRVVETVEDAFLRLPYEPYAPVRRQLLNIWRAVNRVRKEAGYAPIAIECIRMKRRIVRPFSSVEASLRTRKTTLEIE